MPFRLVNAGASFCRLIRIVLQGLRNVICFVDDMWIFTETWKKHLKSTQATLDRLRAAKLTTKPSKCKIGYSKIECLGHNIQDQTLRPKDGKIQAVKDAQRPITKKQVRGFLGFAGFYRKFIPNFSEIMSLKAPLLPCLFEQSFDICRRICRNVSRHRKRLARKILPLPD